MEEKAKGTAKVAWKDVCKPKDQGGLGLKNIGKWNEVMLIKNIWNILNQKNTIWVVRILSMRLKERNFWDVEPSRNASSTWNHLLELRDKLRQHIVTKLGDGLSTSAWFDNWCKLGPLCKIITKREIYGASFNLLSSVADIIENDDWKWPDNWLSKWPQLRSLNVPRLEGSCSDKIIWRNKTGNIYPFSVNLAWEDWKDQSPIANWHKHVWYTQCVPKHAFILWLAIKNRLMTQDRILKWNLLLVEKCTFCKLECDSRDHLFFECTFTTAIWDKLKVLVELDGCNSCWSDILQDVISRKPNGTIISILQRLVIAAAVYCIWKERNARIFNKTACTGDKMVTQITKLVRMKMQSLSIKYSEQSKKNGTSMGIDQC